MLTWVKNILANSVAMCGGIFLISAVSLMTALIAQYVYGLQPCILCLYQRLPYGVAAILGAIGLAALYKHEWQKIAAFTVFLSSVTFLIGSVIASYHFGVEQHWWTSFLEVCAADFDAADTDDLMGLLSAKPAVRCDVVAWADPVFGLSMAGHNALFSMGLAVTCAVSSILIMRKVNGVL